MNNFKQLYRCPISYSESKIKYLDFGMMPLVNNLNNTREESLKCSRYPLIVNYYPENKLSMLSIAMNPNILFSHYFYKSGTNNPYIEHCKEMYQYISKFVKMEDNDTIIDIGGNDGTLLYTFKNEAKIKLNTINIDPSENLGKISFERGIETFVDSWNSDLGNSLNFKNKCKIITSTNVFQHVQDIGNFVSGIWYALKDDGIWCLEFPYWKKDLETNQYDQVYHEHIYYYLLTPIFDLFKKRGMEIIDVSEHKIHGGTLRVISKKGKSFDISTKIQKFIDEEKQFDVNFYKQFNKNVINHIKKSKKTVFDLKKEGCKIAAFGAAAKGCTWLNAAGINHNIIDYVVDDTDIKQNKFIPGTGIQIVNRSTLIKNSPDYIIILAHNFSDYITKSIKPIYKGKFIKMFPQPIIYE